MEALLEDSGWTITVETRVEAVETVLGDENLEQLRQWLDNQENITWLTG